LRKIIYKLLKSTKLLGLARKIFGGNSERNQRTAMEHWRENFSHRWDWKLSEDSTKRTGSIVGPDGFYVRSHFRREEYSIIDALLRRIIEIKGQVNILDVCCGKGHVPFFINANRNRYKNKVKYFGIDASDAQLYHSKIRNPWSFAEFGEGNLFDIQVARNDYDLVLGLQVLNHVGRVKEALKQLTGVTGGILYFQNYVYFENEEFVKRYGEQLDEIRIGSIAWAFNRDKVVEFIDDLGVKNQMWRKITDPVFTKEFLDGSTSEHTLLSKNSNLLSTWNDLDLNEDWKENIITL
tara:strand:- start:109 stop:990 length:882 start_codon:yes stop_codon:yes gene_type:complete